MTLFICRIELHGVSRKDNAYNILHDNMTAAGFNREASRTSDQKKFHMAHATYRYNTSDDTSTSTVHKIARSTLNKTIEDCKNRNPPSSVKGSVYTIKSAEAPHFDGLEPVED